MTNSKRIKLFVLIFFVLVGISQGAVVKLEVLSHPAGSDVFIDDVWRGESPLSLYVSPGKHTIKLEKNGYLSQKQELDAVLPSVLEYNLFPVKAISKEFPIVMYLVNYQESGDRRILYRENEDKLISNLESRFKNMGFTVNIEKPKDEFDLVMDSESIFYSLSEKYPETKLIMFIDAFWSYSSFNQKKTTRLNTNTKIYDPKTSITLSTFQDASESMGVMGDSIAVLEIVEKISQNFLDYIGNYMIQMRGKKVETPKIIEYYDDQKTMLLKTPAEINSIDSVDQDGVRTALEINDISNSPVNVLFLIDRSGSNVDLLDGIKDQIEKIILNLPDYVEWGLMGFDDKIELIQNFTDEFGKWEFSKSRIYASGMTRLYDGIYNAANLLGRKKGIKVAIILTDGIDADYYDTGYGSIKSREDALNFAKENGVILYPVGISGNNYENFMESIAYQFASKYYDSFKGDSEVIAKDIVQNIVKSTYLAKSDILPEMQLKIDGKDFILSDDMRDFILEGDNTLIISSDYTEEEKKTDELVEVTPPVEEYSDVTMNSQTEDIAEKSSVSEETLPSVDEEENIEEPDYEVKDIEEKKPEEENNEITDIETESTETSQISDENDKTQETDTEPEQTVTPESTETISSTEITSPEIPQTVDDKQEEIKEPEIAAPAEETAEVVEPKEENQKQDTTVNENTDSEKTENIQPENTVEEKSTEETETVTEKAEPENTETEIDNQENVSLFPQDIQHPENYKEIYRIANINDFDVDKKGNFLWNENGYVYIWEKEEDRIIGFNTSNKSTLSNTILEFPFVINYTQEELKIYEILENEVTLNWSYTSEQPIAEVSMLEYMFVSVAYENGNVDIISFSGEKLLDFEVMNGKINKMCFDDQNRLIFSTSSNTAGWINLNGKEKPTEIKYTKPIINIFPFNVDKSRFLIIDASGIVHYQRFSNLKPTSRNLNRGIVLLSEVAEDSNLLFTVHWDKKMRAYRLYDLEEMFSISPESNIIDFDVSGNGSVIVLNTADGNTHLLAEGKEFPSTIDFLDIRTPEIKDDAETSEKTETEEQTDTNEVTASTDENKNEEKDEEEIKTEEKEDFEVEGAETIQFVSPEPEVKQEEEEKDEEVLIVMGDQQLPPSDESKDVTDIMQELYTQEEKTGFIPVYGDWSLGIPYKDFGYILAGNERVVMTNSLLDKRFDFDISSGKIIDMDISKYGLLVILCERGVEIWDFEPMLRNPPSLWKKGIKYPITNAHMARFSRNGKKILLIQGEGQYTIIDSDLSYSQNDIHEFDITAITADLTEAERFAFGDSKGQIGFIENGKITVTEKASSTPITNMFWSKDQVYWTDSEGNIGKMGGTAVKITDRPITATYAADIEKEWIMLGTESGSMIIVNPSLKKIGEASTGNKAVKDLRGYKENMLSVDSESNIKSWNLNAGAVIGKKPKFDSDTHIFSEKGIFYVLQKNGDFYTFSKDSEGVTAQKIFSKDMSIMGITKKPIVFNIDGLRYFPFLNGKLVDKALKIYEEGNVSVSDKFMMFWKDDILQIYDIKDEKTLRTFKFGDGNTVNYSTMQNERLFFFFNQSMAIVNPYNPGEAVVVDISELDNGKILEAFLYNNKLGFVDSKGKVYYYNIIENKLGITIDLSDSLENAYYNPDAYKVIGFVDNSVVIYSVVDNNIENFKVDSDVVDLDWIGTNLYVLCSDGVIYEKEI